MSLQEQFQSAIQALYGSDPISQQQANQWLNDFTANGAAWDICLTCIDVHASDTTAFFCANMLLTKIRKEWAKVPVVQRGNLSAVVRYASSALCSCVNGQLAFNDFQQRDSHQSNFPQRQVDGLAA